MILLHVDKRSRLLNTSIFLHCQRVHYLLVKRVPYVNNTFGKEVETNVSVGIVLS